MKGRSILALISMILGVAYGLYALWYWFGGGLSSGTSNSENLGYLAATALTFPHTILAILGALMNTIGFFANSRGFILTAAILYTVSLVVFPPYFMFVILQMILAYISFIKMKKI